MKLYPECFEAGKSLDQYLTVVEIKYDDIFDTVLDRWAELAAALAGADGRVQLDEQGHAAPQKASDERNIFARYGGDVLLYCGFALVARAARLRINSLIASTIVEENEAALRDRRSPPKFALAAHSLGTTVAQDALYQLASGRWVSDDEQLAADPNFSAALSLHRAAGRPRGQPARSLPRERHLAGPAQSGYYSELERNGAYDCHAVWSINHELDPISVVGGAFEPGRGGPTRRMCASAISTARTSTI